MTTKKTKTKTTKSHPWVGRYVLLTTSTRPWAVVAGVLDGVRVADGVRIVALTQARMIVWYAAGSRSVVGVAANGPAAGSRVSPACEACEYAAPEGIHLVSDAARAAIEAEPWT